MMVDPATSNVARVLSPGTMLGRFELLSLLSVGGMAEIYLARTAGIAGFEKLVVVKRMLPHLAMQPDYVDMFLAEARLGAMLDHPNVVAVNDIGEDTGNYYYAMEYVRGPDLRRLMSAQANTGEPLPLHCAIAIGLGMCAGLDHAHGLVDHDGRPLGVVHRDVSLSNVLVSYDGTVKITDFGVAKVTAADTHTRTGSLKGKIGYMSPEQCRGEPLDRRSDIFAIGIILYELTTGRRLFRADRGDFATLQRIVREDAEPPSLRDPSYPPQLEAIVLRALQRDRDRRYPTARELQRDLEALARFAKLAATPYELGQHVTELVPPAPPPAVERARVPVPPSTVTLDTRAGRDEWGQEAPSIQIVGAAPPPDRRRVGRKRAVLIVLAAAIAGAVVSAWALTARDDERRTARAQDDAPPRPAVRPTVVHVDVPEAPADADHVAAIAAEAVAEPAPEPTDDPEETDELITNDMPSRAPSRQRPRPLPRVRRDEPRRKPVAPAQSAIEAAPRFEDPAPEPPPEVTHEPEVDRADDRPDAGAPRVGEPPPEERAPAPAPNPTRKIDVVTNKGSGDAVPSISGIDVNGPLGEAEIRRGVSRVLPAIRACYRAAAKSVGKTPMTRLRVSFEIDESRAARSVRVKGAAMPGLASCVEDAAAKIRTRIAPDVGNAQVTVEVVFDPTST